MSNNFKLKLDIPGIKELRNSAGVTDLIREYTNEIAANAGDAKPIITHARTRVKGIVEQAMTSDDMENNTLLKAVHK
ncbi:MAG: hypothetical protein LKE48_03230 [Solobacterium sp.]|jgi:hypothetical protein|nr:hypothetical protein [Solobacterium sp.]MCH4281517.1 hypothetical protein [Solobacterium sp.]